MTVPGHVKFWLIASIMMFFVMVMLVKPETYLAAADKDIQHIYSAYGEEIGGTIVSNTNTFYTDMVGDGGLKDLLNELHETNDASTTAVFGFERTAAQFSNRLLRTMKLEMYVITLRLNAALQWFAAMAVFTMVAMVDGLVTRKIKLAGYGYTSPAIQANMAHLSIALTGISMAMLYLPVTVPFFWWPMTAFLVALSVRFVTSNIKQVTA